jgi:hypothetical protein
LTKAAVLATAIEQLNLPIRDIARRWPRNPELGQVAAQCIDEHRALPDQEVTDAMREERCLFTPREAAGGGLSRTTPRAPVGSIGRAAGNRPAGNLFSTDIGRCCLHVCHKAKDIASRRKNRAYAGMPARNFNAALTAQP